MSSTIKEINENLNKWKNVCIAMGATEDIAIVEDIIKMINNTGDDTSPKTKGKKNQKASKVKKEESEKTAIDRKTDKVSEKAVKSKTNKVNEKTAKDKNIEELSQILEAYNNKDYEKFSKFKIEFLKIDDNIPEKWDKLSLDKKIKLTKKELNVIYNLLYKPKEVKFIDKVKKDLVHDINYYINNEKRNNALKESKLI